MDVFVLFVRHSIFVLAITELDSIRVTDFINMSKFFPWRMLTREATYYQFHTSEPTINPHALPRHVAAWTVIFRKANLLASNEHAHN